MKLFNRQKPEEEVKRQEEEIMQAGQAVEEWQRLTISKLVLESMDSAERQLKDGLFTYQSEEYYRAQGTLNFIKSLRSIIESPLAERDILVASKQQEGWNE
jgi:uncharacterized protein YjiS (DUF1127 family)